MDIQIKSYQAEGKLSLIQFCSADINTFNYISGSSAIQENKVEICEIDSEGSVNKVAILNYSDSFVFFSDSDLLIGAKQNRILNTSILLEPNSKTIIPVSCVESGRWHSKGYRFGISNINASSGLRYEKAEKVRKNLKKKNEFDADQRNIWANVSEYHKSFACASRTLDYTDIFHLKSEDLENTIDKFVVDAGSNGMVLYFGDKLLNIDLFNSSKIYSEYFLKLLNGGIIEAQKLETSEKRVSEAEATFKTFEFFDNYENLQFDMHKGAGVGKEKRFTTDEITGFELQYGLYLIHLTVLQKN